MAMSLKVTKKGKDEKSFNVRQKDRVSVVRTLSGFRERYKTRERTLTNTLYCSLPIIEGSIEPRDSLGDRILDRLIVQANSDNHLWVSN